MKSLRSAFADGIAYKTSRRSIDLVFSMASHGTDIDPDIEVVTKRCVAFRRLHENNGELAKLSKEIMALYKFKGELGVYDEEIGEEMLAMLLAAGPPGTKERMLLRRKCSPKRPVGHLLESAHMQAAAISLDFELVSCNQGGLPLIRIPYQQLAPMVREHCKRNRTRYAQCTRRETQGLWEMDEEATKMGDSSRSEDKENIVGILHTGATWNRVAAFWPGQAEDKLCSMQWSR